MIRIATLFSIALISTVLLGCSSHDAGHTPQAEAPEAPKADYIVKAAGETVRIEVAANGYTPKTIGIKKGQNVKLEFFRKDAENCGEKLVLPSLNIEKDLPVGKPVVVEVTPTETGELKFACGMDMLRGKLIVTE